MGVCKRLWTFSSGRQVRADPALKLKCDGYIAGEAIGLSLPRLSTQDERCGPGHNWYCGVVVGTGGGDYACSKRRKPATGPKRSRLPMAAMSSFALPSPRIGAIRSSALASTSLWSIGLPGVPRTS
jgi:hypothetical protein